MDAGKLGERVGLLSLAEAGGVFFWEEAGSLWAQVEQKDRPNLFSKVGIGARGVELVIRRRELNLHDALRWRGHHCFLTSIVDEGKLHWKVTAALVRPVPCIATRSVKTRDEYGKPIYAPAPLCSFPGILTEKYLGFVQSEPQGQVEHRMVLVTPKAVSLQSGDVVEAGEAGVFAVRVCYLLDEFKNEYEIANVREP